MGGDFCHYEELNTTKGEVKASPFLFLSFIEYKPELTGQYLLIKKL